MFERPIHILIVEDEIVSAATISLLLSRLGYIVTGIIPRGDEALTYIRKLPPDIVLDINLKDETGGVEMTERMQKECNIPVIYMTTPANAYTANLDSINPYALLTKPFKKLDVQRAVEVVANKIKCNQQQQKLLQQRSLHVPYLLKECIFVRHHDRMIRINIKDILYVQAEQDYCRIFCKDCGILVVMPLNELSRKLPSKYFIRIHFSYIVNLTQISEIAPAYVLIGRKAIPVADQSRGELLQRLQMV